MDPMPPLQAATYPPRVEPPTFLDRHPRAAGALRMLPWLVLTLLMVDRLRTDGFSWHVVLGLVIFAFNLGYHFAKLEHPNPPVASGED